MKIAILGAHGFLGQKLSRLLVAQGHEVVGYVLNAFPENNSGFECKSVSELLTSPLDRRLSYDVSINLAARRSTKNQLFTEDEVNEFTFRIPKEFILRTTSPHSIVINVSTYIQNFTGKIGRTVDSYGAAKQKLSQFLEYESAVRGIKTSDLFFFTLYGIADRSSRLVPLLLDAARSGNEIALSPGHQLMNLLYVDDAAQNILNCISPKEPMAYQKSYVWDQEYFSVRELVTRIEESVGRKINCSWGSRDYAGHEMMSPWPIPMNQLSGFTASTKLEHGIATIWNSTNNIVKP